MNIEVTVFTPTYNRAYILNKCYESLKMQTHKNFEWLIIDDGSIDNTEELVEKWIEENNEFDIIYRKVENGGKHRAINKGIDLARGRLFFIVDSDDYITKDAIEKIIDKEKTIKQNEEKFAGIAMNKGYNSEKIVGNTFEGEYIDATSLERNKYKIIGDKAEIFYTKILKQNKFPEFENEKFVTESLVWNRIARKGYKIRWFQDIIYICEYMEDGLTKQGQNRYRNCKNGLRIFIKEYIESYNLNYLRRCLQYGYYSKVIYNNKNIKKSAEELDTIPINVVLGIYMRKILNFIKR